MWDWFLAHVPALESFHPLLYERVIAGVVPLPGMRDPQGVRDFFADYMQTRPENADVVRLSLEKLEINLAMKKAAESAPNLD